MQIIEVTELGYRVLRFNNRTQLVEQDIDYESLGVEIVRPDVDSAQFKAAWRRIPLTDRLLMWVVLPIVVLVRLFGGTRRIWSSAMERNDLPSPEDEDAAEAMPELERALSGERDDRLLAALRRLHEERGDEAIEVAVVYGAGHVPAIVTGLMRHGYRPRSGEWLTLADV
ncbi:hypothetical protein ACFP2T_32325 [Plantactinospora solaniradicis]|uniref:Conjugal transfer protein TraB n=1 Tax=Plantactinospora solaniradicis TaxID=1723736 RepID=A0ABW1KIU4_9ACTN